MIRSLRIENFALIEQVHIQFESGFTVITGETGSGKSILLNALNLILGERANFSVIGKARDKSVVEAEIDISGFDLKAFFQEHELDYFDQTIVRREIYTQGRSRAFINDVPVQLATLKAFSSKLMHIHSQYNTLELKDKEYQLRLLDVLAGAMELRATFHAQHKKHLEDKKARTLLQEQLSELEQKQDYDSFQLQELQSLNLGENDYEQIRDELNKIENADDLRDAYGTLMEALSGDMGIMSQVQMLLSGALKNVEADPSLAALKERVESILIELRDISDEAENQLEKVELDPEKLQEYAEKMDVYNRVLFKHRANSQEELMQLESELDGSGRSLDDLKQQLEQLDATIAKEETELRSLAERLHAKRKEEAPKISASIQQALDALKLKDTLLEFELTALETFTPFGQTGIEMVFSPNKGVAPVPIHAAASGGELSRVMLALQNLVSKKEQLQTILFDEIDTGVSGDVAQKIGALLKDMGTGMQVIAITHLPQVAAKGGQHFSVYKEVVNNVTRTFIKELNAEERLFETARLMSGDTINEAALENARALMS